MHSLLQVGGKRFPKAKIPATPMKNPQPKLGTQQAKLPIIPTFIEQDPDGNDQVHSDASDAPGTRSELSLDRPDLECGLGPLKILKDFSKVDGGVLAVSRDTSAEMNHDTLPFSSRWIPSRGLASFMDLTTRDEATKS